MIKHLPHKLFITRRVTNQDLRGTLLSPKLTSVTKKIAEGNIKNYLQKYNYHKIRNGKAKRRDSEKNY